MLYLGRGVSDVSARSLTRNTDYKPTGQCALICSCEQELALELRQKHRILGRFVGRRRPGSKEVAECIEWPSSCVCV